MIPATARGGAPRSAPSRAVTATVGLTRLLLPGLWVMALIGFTLYPYLA